MGWAAPVLKALTVAPVACVAGLSAVAGVVGTVTAPDRAGLWPTGGREAVPQILVVAEPVLLTRLLR